MYRDKQGYGDDGLDNNIKLYVGPGRRRHPHHGGQVGSQHLFTDHDTGVAISILLRLMVQSRHS